MHQRRWFIRIGLVVTTAVSTVVTATPALAGSHGCEGSPWPANGPGLVCVTTYNSGSTYVGNAYNEVERYDSNLCNVRAYNEGRTGQYTYTGFMSSYRYGCFGVWAAVTNPINRTMVDPSYFHAVMEFGGVWSSSSPTVTLQS